jgi:RNA methyltransferase, TrmH family
MHGMERVTSRQNAVVKRFRELARAARKPAERHGAGEALLDGEHLLDEALACGVPVDVAAFSGRQIDNVLSPLSRLAKEVRQRGGRSLIVSDQVLAAISPVQQPSGVVAIARPRPAELQQAFSSAGIVLVLAGLQDPGNVGAIIRAAAAFGASGAVAIDGTANPFSWKALRGAMGGTFRVPVAAGHTMPEVMAAAAERAIPVIAAVPRGGTPLPQIDFRQSAAIVLGGEGAGIPAAAMAAAHESLTIPMREPVESLNVAVAAALILYEASRQRNTGARR